MTNLKFLPYLYLETFYLFALKLALRSSIEMLLIAVKNSFSSLFSLSCSTITLTALASDGYLKADDPPDFNDDLKIDFLPDKASTSGSLRADF